MKFLDRILGKTPTKLPELDVVCYNCKGSGKTLFTQCVGQVKYYKCDVCGGSGRQFTQAGVDLFNFITTHRDWIRNGLYKP